MQESVDKNRLIEFYQRTLEYTTAPQIIHFNLGRIYLDLAQYEEALEQFELVQSLAPEIEEVWLAIGKTHLACFNFEEARKALEKSLELQPKNPEVLHYMGNLENAQGKYLEAEHYYLQVLQLEPQSTFTHIVMGEVLLKQGEYDKAHFHFNKAERIDANDSLTLIKALSFPLIYQSKEEVYEYRAKLEEQLSQIEQQELIIGDPLNELGVTPFLLAYQGLDDRSILEKIARILKPSLNTQITLKPEPTSSIKVGFISRYFKSHSIANCFANIILSMSKDIELIGFMIPGEPEDQMTKLIEERVSQFIRLPWNLTRAQEMIVEQGLDVLVYTDIGMEPFSYYLAFNRLARKQIVLPGHPVTSGLNTIDYYVSSSFWEHPQAARNYTEKLVLLDTPLAQISPPVFQAKSREQLGLSSTNNLYLCPATLFKIHPDFDAALEEILAIDPEAEIIFFQYENTKLHRFLQTRFKMSLTEPERITFLPWASFDDFLSILNSVDVVLDPFHFNLGSTAYYAFSLGKPVVSWPRQYLKSRGVIGPCQWMGVEGLIVNHLEDYASTATQVAMDKAYQVSLQTKILNQQKRLFEQPYFSHHLTRFIESIIRF